MRKKTEPQTPKHPTTSRAGAIDKALIAKGKTAPRSYGEEASLTIALIERFS
jgi:hypothetical protein